MVFTTRGDRYATRRAAIPPNGPPICGSASTPHASTERQIAERQDGTGADVRAGGVDGRINGAPQHSRCHRLQRAEHRAVSEVADHHRRDRAPRAARTGIASSPYAGGGMTDSTVHHIALSAEAEALSSALRA